MSVIWDAVSIITVCVCVKIGQISRGTGLKPPGIGLGYLPNVRSVKIQRGVKNSGQKYQEEGETGLTLFYRELCQLAHKKNILSLIGQWKI